MVPRVPADELAAVQAQLLETEQLLARIPELERVVDRLETRDGELAAALEQERLRAAHLAAELEKTSALLDDVTASVSWRVTAPLRALKRRDRR